MHPYDDQGSRPPKTAIFHFFKFFISQDVNLNLLFILLKKEKILYKYKGPCKYEC